MRFRATLDMGHGTGDKIGHEPARNCNLTTSTQPTFPANKSSARSNRKFHASSRSLSTAVGTISNSITSTVQPLPQSSGEILFELVVTMQKFWPPRMERRQLTTLLDVFERVQT